MNKIEELKKISRGMITASHYNQLDESVFDGYINEIYQLFEGYKSPEEVEQIVQTFPAKGMTTNSYVQLDKDKKVIL